MFYQSAVIIERGFDPVAQRVVFDRNKPVSAAVVDISHPSLD